MSEAIAEASAGRPAWDVSGIRTVDEAIAVLLRNDDLRLTFRYGEGHELPEVLQVLAHSRQDEIRGYVLRNEYTPPETLSYFGTFITPQTETPRGADLAIAKHRNTPPELLRELSRHASASVRAEIAKNPSTPVDCLDYLAGDTFTRVAVAVASNPRAQPDTLDRLSRYVSRWSLEETHLLAAYAGRQIPRETLLRTVNEQVAAMAERAGDFPGDVRKVVANNENTPKAALSRLAQNGYEAEVAGNRNAPSSALAWIANQHWADDEFWDGGSLITSLASNPNTPPHRLERLARDGDHHVRRRVAENPNAPIEVLRRLLDDTDFAVRAAASEAAGRRTT